MEREMKMYSISLSLFNTYIVFGWGEMEEGSKFAP
jgi:hypothetical protein